MLYTNCTVTINGEDSIIDKPVILYRGDKEVEIKFYIMKNTFYQSIVTRTTNVVSDVDASFSQLVIRIPEGEPIFSAVTPVEEDGAIIFKFTAEMIDEVKEVGSYDFQIRLLDENKTSRATIPPVIEGIKIKEPIAIENVTITNEVNLAKVNEAIITNSEDLNAFDEQGNYIKTQWNDKDLITDAKLNKIEVGIEGVNQKIKGIRIDSTDQPQTQKSTDIPSGITITNYTSVNYSMSINGESMSIPLGIKTLDLDLESVTSITIYAPIDKLIIKDVPNLQKVSMEQSKELIIVENTPNLTEFSTNSNSKNITIKNASNLEKARVCCEELSIQGVDNLRRLRLYGDICNNAEAMTAIAQGLKDRNNMAWGSVVTQNQDVRREVEDAFIQKDWYFGTDKYVSSSQPHFDIMSIKDIWESAEYGEGRTYAVADTEIDDGGEGCTNALLNEFSSGDIPASNYLGKFNFCTSEPNFIGGTQHSHGLGVLGIIAMDGSYSNYYGIAPKAKFYCIKIATKEGKSNQDDWCRAIQKSTELGVDAMNLSSGINSASTIDGTITTTNKDICMAFADNKGILCCANGNAGTNTINEDGTVTSVHEGVQYPHNGSFSIAVGGISKNEKILDFSTCSDGLDFMAHGGSNNTTQTGDVDVITRYYKNKTTGAVQHVGWNGTSFASPMILGCVLLMKNLFYKKYKREATQQELIEYMSKRTRDMGLEAYQQGYGIFDFMAYNPNPKEVIKKL